MSDFLERLKKELTELEERTQKLEEFIGGENFSSIDWAQQDLLKVQLQSMKTYSKCLEVRLYRLENSDLK